MAEKLRFLSDEIEDLPFCEEGEEFTAGNQNFIVKKKQPLYFEKDNIWCLAVIQRLSDGKCFMAKFRNNYIGFTLEDIDEYLDVAYVYFVECVPKQVVMKVFESAE